MEFFEVVHTQRAIRRFKPDPVPDDVIWKMIDAAIRAPSGSNSQPWAWLVVREESERQVISNAVREGVGSLEEALAAAEQLPTEWQRRMRRASVTFRWNVMWAPVLIIPCLVSPTSPVTDMDSIWVGSSIYQAVQNLLLAARAQGIGTLMTTFNIAHEDLITKEFALPENAWSVRDSRKS